MKKIAIIGGGPAGLRAAEILSGIPGIEVHLFDAKASVGRKFLVAGRGGLNLTHSEAPEQFVSRYSGPADLWGNILDGFSASNLREWAKSLGHDTYIGTSGRIFPKSEYAAGLLRAWVKRLHEQNVHFHMSHSLRDMTQSSTQWTLVFQTAHDQEASYTFDAVCLALGGASWPQTGSDGKWDTLLTGKGIKLTPFTAANCGWEVDWTKEILPHIEGVPLKNIRVIVGHHQVSGELVVTRYGIEGGPLYALGRYLRVMKQPAINIDWKPTVNEKALTGKLGAVKNQDEIFDRAAKAWNLSIPCRHLMERAGARKLTVHQLVNLLKNYRLILKGPRPIDEAISTAGGIRWEELTPALMLRKLPGVFAAGEMIDWEAPTGGYLLQGSFATGTYAAKSMMTYLGIH
ncbi:MAG: TIGR03862 family flavoprotein [Verrucomicrobiota bacterium]|nr:TIGR03862 family flavoprotein [Verrucomicrobiota bacterium]